MKKWREFGALGHSLPCNLIFPPFLPQVMYKKFHISCDVGHNETAVESKSPPVLPIQGLNRSCEAQMFTVDSQVGMQANRACTALRPSGVLDIGGFQVSDMKSSGGTRSMENKGWNPIGFNLLYLAILLDVLHSAHYGFCLCLPP